RATAVVAEVNAGPLVHRADHPNAIALVAPVEVRDVESIRETIIPEIANAVAQGGRTQDGNDQVRTRVHAPGRQGRRKAGLLIGPFESGGHIKQAPDA